MPIRLPGAVALLAAGFLAATAAHAQQPAPPVASWLATQRQANPRTEQDTQVSLEVRVVTVPEVFFERIGVDFNVNLDGASEQAPAKVPVQVTRQPSPCLPDKGAFLTDKQLFLFLEAAQGDQHTNILQAPKVTTLNGQNAVVDCTQKQSFVTGIEVARGNEQPVFTPKKEDVVTGFRMSARPVVSADRRYVQVDLKIDQTDLASPAVPLFPVLVQVPDGKGKSVQFTQFLQQPRVKTIRIEKNLTIPDGGTVLLGGLKEVTEGHCEFGPPVLGNVPYVNRLFKNVGYGRETQNVYVLVTPRVLVNEEEECRPTGCSHCKDAPVCPACPKVANAEESEPCAPACRQSKVLAELLKAYDEACAAGHKDEAAKFAQAALILDPTCFAKGRGR